MGQNDRLSELLSISLITSIVLDLYMQVERAFAAIDFLTVLVGAYVLPIYLPSRPAVVLLAGVFGVLLLLLTRCQGFD